MTAPVAGEITTRPQPTSDKTPETPPTNHGHHRVTRTSTFKKAAGTVKAKNNTTAAVIAKEATAGPGLAGSSTVREATPRTNTATRAAVSKANVSVHFR
jgi:hypothetical protein